MIRRFKLFTSMTDSSVNEAEMEEYLLRRLGMTKDRAVRLIMDGDFSILNPGNISRIFDALHYYQFDDFDEYIKTLNEMNIYVSAKKLKNASGAVKTIFSKTCICKTIKCADTTDAIKRYHPYCMKKFSNNDILDAIFTAGRLINRGNNFYLSIKWLIENNYFEGKLEKLLKIMIRLRLDIKYFKLLLKNHSSGKKLFVPLEQIFGYEINYKIVDFLLKNRYCFEFNNVFNTSLIFPFDGPAFLESKALEDNTLKILQLFEEAGIKPEKKDNIFIYNAMKMNWKRIVTWGVENDFDKLIIDIKEMEREDAIFYLNLGFSGDINSTTTALVNKDEDLSDILIERNFFFSTKIAFIEWDENLKYLYEKLYRKLGEINKYYEQFREDKLFDAAEINETDGIENLREKITSKFGYTNELRRIDRDEDLSEEQRYMILKNMGIDMFYNSVDDFRETEALEILMDIRLQHDEVIFDKELDFEYMSKNKFFADNKIDLIQYIIDYGSKSLNRYLETKEYISGETELVTKSIITDDYLIRMKNSFYSSDWEDDHVYHILFGVNMWVHWDEEKFTDYIKSGGLSGLKKIVFFFNNLLYSFNDIDYFKEWYFQKFSGAVIHYLGHEKSCYDIYDAVCFLHKILDGDGKISVELINARTLDFDSPDEAYKFFDENFYWYNDLLKRRMEAEDNYGNYSDDSWDY